MLILILACLPYQSAAKLLLALASTVILASDPAGLMTVFYCLKDSGIMQLLLFYLVNY
jgi:hypothetical protein